MVLESKAFTPTSQNPQWYKLSLILPSIYNNSMSMLEALQPMLDCINDVNTHMNELVDWVNQRDTDITDYINQQLEDFTNANNEFYQKIDNMVQKFIEDVTADIEAFKEEVRQTVEEYKNYLDQKYQEFTDKMTAEFNALKQSFDELKAAVDKFMEDMTAAFEQFKQEILDLIKGIQNDVADWKAEWEQFKLYIKAYVDGLFDGLEQYIKDNLETIVKKLLKEVFGETAGICLGYDADSNTINLLYDEHFARDDQNRLTWVGGSAGGGDSIEAGQGIDLQDNPETQKKTVSVKLAADGGLGFDENGGLKSTATGGLTLEAGEAINVQTVENTATISAKTATKDTLGVVKTGDPLTTGLDVAEDGTISIHKWTAIDTTTDQIIFDSNMEDVMPTWQIDCKYNPRNFDSTVYIKLSDTTLSELGIPTNAQVVDWTPEKSFIYETVPDTQISTNGLIGQANLKVTLKKDASNSIRNGSGTLVLTWIGKENVIRIPFVISHADMELDDTTPIKIDGQAIQNFGTYRFTSLTEKVITFVMKDGTEVTSLLGLKENNVFGSDFTIESESNNAELNDYNSPTLLQKNIVDGIVTLKIKPSSFGYGTNDSLQTLIQFYVNYDAGIWDTLVVVPSKADYSIVNYSTDFTMTLQFPGYNGASFTVTSGNSQIIGIGDYQVESKNFAPNNAIAIYAGRYGTAQVSITTSYVSNFSKTVDFTVTLDVTKQPHFAITTNSTLVGDTGLDIGNPGVNNSENQFSKAQGLITFWVKSEPMNTLFAYIDINKSFTIKAQSGETIADFSTQEKTPGYVNDNRTYDFGNLAVGTTLIAKYTGNNAIAAYSIVIGKVVD